MAYIVRAVLLFLIINSAMPIAFAETSAQSPLTGLNPLELWQQKQGS